MYTFTKLLDSVHECGGNMKFGTKNEEYTRAVYIVTWHFLQLTARLNNNWMNEQ